MRPLLRVLGTLALLSAVPHGAPAATADEEHAVVARNLAENILGRGLVKTSRATGGGRSFFLAWESATFKPTHAPSHSREMLAAEVSLVSSAIFRVIRLAETLGFEIHHGRRILCTGRHSRDGSPEITFARELGP